MQDLDRTFRSLDELPTPDVWDEALAREPRTGPSPHPGHRVFTVVVALGVFAAAALVTWRAFTPSVIPPGGDNGRPHEELGLRISVPRGWHLLSFTTDWGPNPRSGLEVSNVVLPMPASTAGAPLQAPGTSLPRDGVALVVYEGTSPGQRLTTLPLATSDFAHGSAPAGAPTLDVTSFTGNGRTYVVTVKVGPNVSSADRRAANKVIRSITWGESSNRTLTIRQPLILDPPIDSVTFASPKFIHDRYILAAKDALMRFESVDPAFTLRPNSTIFLGLYTAAVGDGTYRFHNRLAYGIRYHQCLSSPNPTYSGAPSAVPPCTRWLFLDASTGKMLEGVTQHPA